MLRNVARDLDENDRRHDRTDAWRDHMDERFDGLQRILIGFIVTAAGLTIAAAINIAVLIVRG